MEFWDVMEIMIGQTNYLYYYIYYNIYNNINNYIIFFLSDGKKVLSVCPFVRVFGMYLKKTKLLRCKDVNI